MVSVHETTMNFHETKDEMVQWLDSISQARRDKQKVNAECGGMLFHAFRVVN
jgi:hypothetical protein